MTSKLAVTKRTNSEAEKVILSDDALAFVAGLASGFSARIDEALVRRELRQKALLKGELYDFLPETKAVRDGDWKVAPLPDDLLDRRVEITGPV
ncbi:MAG: malate synthase A, partial [Polyangiaceae bacterium]